MTAFATPAQLASFIQSDIDTATADLLLDLASALIRDAAGGSDPPAAIAQTICLNVSARAYANAVGTTQETVGDYAAQYPLGISALQTGVYLTSPERAIITRSVAQGEAIGSFPCAPGWPDPPRVHATGWTT
jgi:hypothetical protein